MHRFSTLMHRLLASAVFLVALGEMALAAQEAEVSQLRLPPRSSVSTPLGLLHGAYCDARGQVRKFTGLPYAKAPVGPLRFAAPRKWDTKYPVSGRNATQQGPRCLQLGDSQSSEDCLFINVWTPSTSATARLPVRVYIHGGGYQKGSGSELPYDGCAVASDGNVVAVTFNYRLGVLGYLAHPNVTDDSAGGSTGNWGLLDQRMALRWVRENIRFFGGDPAKVLLTGEGAGAYSTFLHTLTPGSHGLFAAAAPMSRGGDLKGVDFLTDAYAKGRALVEELGCDARGPGGVRACLAAKTSEEMLGAVAMLGSSAEMRPAIDGVLITKPPVQLVQEGKAAGVPIMIGVNADEGVLEASHAVSFLYAIDDNTFLTALRGIVPVPHAFVAKVLAQYNNATRGSWFGALKDAVTDAGYWCPNYRMARAFAAQPTSRVRFFVLNAVRPSSECVLKSTLGVDWGLNFADWFGAFHGYGVPLSFLAPHRPAFASQCNFTQEEAQVSSFLSGILSSFAASGSPMPPRSASLGSQRLRDLVWPEWSSGAQDIVQLGGTGAPVAVRAADVMDSRCKLWDNILEYAVTRGTHADA